MMIAGAIADRLRYERDTLKICITYMYLKWHASSVLTVVQGLIV